MSNDNDFPRIMSLKDFKKEVQDRRLPFTDNQRQALASGKDLNREADPDSPGWIVLGVNDLGEIELHDFQDAQGKTITDINSPDDYEWSPLLMDIAGDLQLP